MAKTETKYHPIFDDCVIEAGKKLSFDHSQWQLETPWVENGWRCATDGAIAVWEPCKERDTPDRVVPDITALHHGDFNTAKARRSQIGDADRFRGHVVLRTGYAVAVEYMALLLKHGACVFLPRPLRKGESIKHPAKFTIGDTIEGRVMPMRVEN